MQYQQTLINIAKSRVFKYFSIFLISAIFFFLVAPITLDNSSLKFEIEQKISESLHTSFEINGNVKIRFIPTPAIIAEDVVLKNYNQNNKFYNFYAQKVVANLSLQELISAKIKISEVKFYSAILESYYNLERQGLQNDFTSAIQNISDKKKSNFGIKLFSPKGIKASEIKFPKKIAFQNSRLINYDRFDNEKKISEISGFIKIKDEKIQARGSFFSEGIENNFKLLANFNSKDSIFEIASATSKIEVKGRLSSKKNQIEKTNFDGNINIEILNLKDFYKNYISPKSIILAKINPSLKSIKISGKITNRDGEINGSNIIINSDVMSGKGEISINLTNKIPSVDIDFELENIDLDDLLLKKSDTANIQKSADNKEENYINLQSKNIDISAEIKVAKAKYFDDEIKNINLYLTVSNDGQILILPLTMTIPGGGIVRLNGSIENEKESKFIGKIDVEGKNLGSAFKWLKVESENLKYDSLKDYLIYSDIMITPSLTNLSNFYLNLNNQQSEYLGEIKIDSSEKISNIKSSFRVNKFKVDDYFLTSKNTYLSKGSLFQNFLWLNDLSSNNEVSLFFDKLIYKDDEYANQSLKLRLGQGYFALEELSLKSEKTNLNASFNLDISGSSPKLDIKLLAENFSHKDISDKDSIIDQFYALPSIQGFYGNILLKAKSAKFNETEVKNIEISGGIKDGTIDFSKCKFSMYGGNIEYYGMLGMRENKSFSGNLKLSSVQLENILSNFANIKNIKGTANISAGIIASSGEKYDVKNNLIANIKFNSVGVSIGGYGLSSLITKMFFPKNFANELKNPEKILFDLNSSTTFKQASGSIAINKNSDGKFKINISSPAISGIFSGKTNLYKNRIDGLASIVFLSGSTKKKTPIAIATTIKGKLDAPLQNTNLDQVRQYLGLRSAPSEVPIENINENKITELLDEKKNQPTQEVDSDVDQQEKSMLIKDQ
jgi:uncharacterized protein involved in outer membrane biogenesis